MPQEIKLTSIEEVNRAGVQYVCSLRTKIWMYMRVLTIGMICSEKPCYKYRKFNSAEQPKP